MKRIIVALLMTHAMLSACVAAFGQDFAAALSQDLVGMAKNAPSLSAVLRQFCGSISNFSANADCEISIAGQTPWVMPLKLAFWNGRLRQEIDIGAMPNIPIATREAAKKMNCNREIFIVRLDKKMIYDLFPDFEAYIEIPVSEDSIQKIEDIVKKSTFDKTPLGEEVLDGYSCVKTKLASQQFTSDQATVWYAKYLKDFPIRVEMPSLNIHFKNVDLTTFNPRLFEVPTNYVRQPDSQAVIKIAVERFQKTNDQGSKQGQQVPAVNFDPALPHGWTAIQQNQTNGTNGYAERVAKVASLDGKTQIYIQFSTPSALEQVPASFTNAAQAWKESSSILAKKAGFEITDEKFRVLPRDIRMQATLSFKITKGQATLYAFNRFWMDEGMAVKVAVISAQDIRDDNSVVQILDSIKARR
jgi:hypothetical protein